MRLSKQILLRLLASITVLALLGLSAVTRPSAVAGAPLPQGTAPPRPTVGPSPTPSQPSDKPLDSQLGLVLVVDRKEANPGDSLRYQAQVSNRAGREATNVWLTCDLPERVDVTEVTTTLGEIHRYGQRVSIELGRLQPSFDSQQVVIRAEIAGDVAPGTELVHRANLTSDQAGGGERSVTTVVIGAVPTVGPGKAAAADLPTTGGSGSWWLVAGFSVLIVVAAAIGIKEGRRLER